MSAVYFLLLACLSGYLLVKYFFPTLYHMEGFVSLSGKTVKPARWLVVLPASFLTGTLILTWSLYMAAYLTRETGSPMYYGNLIVLLLFTFLAAVVLLMESRRKKEKSLSLVSHLFAGTGRQDCIFAFIVLAVTVFLMFYTFRVSGNQLVIGLSVFSDFSPHMAMIRSFSHGSNFPTEYPFFADGTVRYHFMFQFLAGTLEYLGMRIDWAFNLPSILSFAAFVILLYVLGYIVTGRKAVGILAACLFFFRSSFAFFSYFKDTLTAKPARFPEFLKTLLTNDNFIGKTPNESWGFWNQNVFLNQRHLAFGLGVMMLVLIIVYPLFREMISRLAAVRKAAGAAGNGRAVEAADAVHGDGQEAVFTEGPEVSGGQVLVTEPQSPFSPELKCLFADRTAWLMGNSLEPVFVGIVLGLLSFWNGAVVIAILPVLFILALMSVRRLEYLVIAVIAIALSYLESGFFTGSGSSVVKPLLTLGFISPDKTFLGILSYLVELLGVLPFVLAAALYKPLKGTRWLFLAYLTPMLLAFTLQLTPDIGVNHKYVIISVILLNIIAADFLFKLYRIRITRAAAFILAILMILTGAVDLITVYNRNNPGNIHGMRPVPLNLEDPLLKWVEKNTGPNEIFLTNTIFLHPLLISGRKIYLGWHYFSWSAGYDTPAREQTAKKMFNPDSKDELVRLVRENRISYIMIDDDLRKSDVYKVNEGIIAGTFEKVYMQESGNTVIYKTAAK